MSPLGTGVLERAPEPSRTPEHTQRLADHAAAVAALQDAATWPVVARTELSRRLSEQAAALTDACLHEALR